LVFVVLGLFPDLFALLVLTVAGFAEEVGFGFAEEGDNSDGLFFFSSILFACELY